MADGIALHAVGGLPEMSEGDDVAALIVEHARSLLRDGVVVVVTSKIVSLAAGLLVSGERSALVAAHTDRVVARRGATTIVRTRQGLVLAAAGLDTSNLPAGRVLALPSDPDADAVALRRSLRRLSGANVAVVITDTAGRPWRLGQTDVAIGVAGLEPLHDLAGQPDTYGNALSVTAPAVADAVAAAADLVKGKLNRIPVCVVTGLESWVLDPDRDGLGARALMRPEESDLFGLGAFDAVRAAVRRDDPGSRRGFPVAASSRRSLVGDAMADSDPQLIDVVPRASDDDRSGWQAWDVVAVLGADRSAALWEAASLTDRLKTMAFATRREVRVNRRDDGPLARFELRDPSG